MATGAVSLSEEEAAAQWGIARERMVGGGRPQGGDEHHQRIEFPGWKREGRHAALRNPVCDRIAQLLPGIAAFIATAAPAHVDYAGGVFSTRSVQAMASGAAGFELLLPQFQVLRRSPSGSEEERRYSFHTKLNRLFQDHPNT